VSRFPEHTLLIAQGRKINDSMPLFAVKKIMKIQPVTKNTKIAVLGFTYKPDVDDIRESPVLKIIALLKEEGYNVSVHDPFVAEGVYDNTSIEDCLKDADLMLLGVDHKVFKQTDLNYAYGLMRNKVILDTRNFLNLDKAKQIGFKCYLLGEGLIEG